MRPEKRKTANYQTSTVTTKLRKKEDLINKLPAEILLKILEYSFSENYLLVCKNWKELLETYHVFKKVRFHQKINQDENWELFRNSQRKFLEISFHVHIERFKILNSLREFLTANPQLKSITVIIRFHSKSLISESYFYKIVRSIQHIQCIRLIVKSPIENLSSIVAFEKTTNLEIQIQKPEDGKLLQLIEIPGIEKFKFTCFSKSIIEVSQNFFDFIVKHKNNLQSVAFYSEANFVNFRWDESEFHLENRLGHVYAKVTEFLENKTMKYMDMLFCAEKNFVEFILEKKFMHFSSARFGIKLLNYLHMSAYEYNNISSIKLVVLGEFSEEWKEKVLAVFPKIQELHIVSLSGTFTISF